MPPQGRFVLPESAGQMRHVIAVAAGSGITPVLGIARQALIHEPPTRFTLVYGNRTRDSMMFGAEIEALKDRCLGRFDYVPVFSRAGEVDAPLFEGRISGEKLDALGETLIDLNGAERVFLCGPGDMIKSCRDALFARGLTREQVVHEFFGPPGKARAVPQPTAERKADGQTVTVILDGSRHVLQLKDGETVLQAALAAGLKAPYACAGGMCSTCRAKIVSGSARMLLNYSLEPWEIEKGFTLACQAVPTSDALVVDWDAM
jgi:ring-1,2-phenylacetyl-CoA epoxidase subunit PaaE